jgi:hypothetical protein
VFTVRPSHRMSRGRPTFTETSRAEGPALIIGVRTARRRSALVTSGTAGRLGASTSASIARHHHECHKGSLSDRTIAKYVAEGKAKVMKAFALDDVAHTFDRVANVKARFRAVVIRNG